MSREAFGPNLRRIRIQRGITIERIAAGTKINAELLKDLERNDFSRWPVGIYARAYVRQYAYAIGVDPDSTVDEFCRWFPEGDRRAERVVREQASIVGHDLAWKDELPEKTGTNRRGGAAPRDERPPEGLLVRLRRAFSKA
jgi:transcriptional regulator with XRE-family HTH domain